MTTCLLCSPVDADRALNRVEVWRDEYWRLAMLTAGPIAGFAHLEPLRHIPHITDLDGAEAASLGGTLARVTSALKSATGADLVYINVFGERIAHLHFNLAPHRAGGPGMLRPGAVDLPLLAFLPVADQVRQTLNSDDATVWSERQAMTQIWRYEYARRR